MHEVLLIDGVELFHADGGWHWRVPGSDSHGPFETNADALADAWGVNARGTSMTDNTVDRLWFIACGILVVMALVAGTIPHGATTAAEIGIVRLALFGSGLLAIIVLLFTHSQHYDCGDL